MLKVMQTTTSHTVFPTARHTAEHKPVKSVRIISLGSEPELRAATRAGRLPAALQVSGKEVEVSRQARRGSKRERQDTAENRSQKHQSDLLLLALNYIHIHTHKLLYYHACRHFKESSAFPALFTFPNPHQLLRLYINESLWWREGKAGFLGKGPPN